MKYPKILWIFVLCLGLTACGEVPAEEPTAEQPVQTTEQPSLAEDEEPTVLLCRIVDGAEEGNLLLAELDEGIAGGKGVYRLNLEGVAVTLDGEPADASVLKDGMPVDVAFNGAVQESFPAQFGEAYSVAAWSRGRGRNGMGAEYDVCGLYLQVLDDLWQTDPALNENITQAALDLSEVPGGLTEGEKAALTWRFGELHGVEAFEAAFEELREQGYLTEEALGGDAPEGAVFLHWEDGCLFSIRPNEGHEGELYTLPVIFFDAEKWRSSMGAYCFYDCSAGWGQDGTWSGYTVGSHMIS